MMARAPRCVTALLMNDPLPDRLERAEALRLSLPAPRPEQPLSDWLTNQPPAAGLPPAETPAGQQPAYAENQDHGLPKAAA